MKDIIITSQKIKRERNIYLICFLLSFAINIIAILVYTRPWIEIFTQLGYVLVISFSSISYYGFRVYSLSGYAISFEKEVTALRFLKID